MTDTQTLTLTAFLEARIADDRDALEHVIDHLRQIEHKPGGISVAGRDVYDVRRVLRELEARLRIVEWCGERERVWVGPTWNSGGDAARASDFVPGAIAHPADSVVLRILASVHADHPDYRAEWAL